MNTETSRIKPLISAGLAVALVASASFIGQLATRPNLEPWYAGLVKPVFNPPDWVFAPVWTALYISRCHA
jgi:translocator protein